MDLGWDRNLLTAYLWLEVSLLFSVNSQSSQIVLLHDGFDTLCLQKGIDALLDLL